MIAASLSVGPIAGDSIPDPVNNTVSLRIKNSYPEAIDTYVPPELRSSRWTLPPPTLIKMCCRYTQVRSTTILQSAERPIHSVASSLQVCEKLPWRSVTISSAEFLERALARKL